MRIKNLSSPFSTGGGGVRFENIVQSSYVVLMLTGGFAPALPCWPIESVMLQGKIEGFETDDMIVTVSNDKKEKRKMICQIKHEVEIQKSNEVFQEVINGFWADYNNNRIFNKKLDNISLITGIINRTDYSLINILDQAKHTEDKEVFFERINQAKFISNTSRRKLKVLKNCLKIANNDVDLTNDELYSFLKIFNILVYDVGRQESVALSLIRSHITQFCISEIEMIWGRITDIVGEYNQNAAKLTRDSIPSDLKTKFEEYKTHSAIHSGNIINSHGKMNFLKIDKSDELVMLKLALIGAWNEKCSEDVHLLEEYLNDNYANIKTTARKYIESENGVVSVIGSVWRINDVLEIYRTNSKLLLDSDFDEFRGISIKVLSEKDSIFTTDSSNESLFYRPKKFTYSNEIREGIANGVAIIRNIDDLNSSCSVQYNIDTTRLIIRELLSNKDWQSWISLDNLMPILCEASPKYFLKYINEVDCQHFFRQLS